MIADNNIPIAHDYVTPSKKLLTFFANSNIFHRHQDKK